MRVRLKKSERGRKSRKILQKDQMISSGYLVGEKDDGDGLAVGKDDLGIDIILPLGDGLEGGHTGDIKDHQGTHSLLVVHPGHVAEPLLTCKSRKIQRYDPVNCKEETGEGKN